MKDLSDYTKYYYQCQGCQMRHPTREQQCFFCGKIDTMKFLPIKQKRLPLFRGTSISIKL